MTVERFFIRSAGARALLRSEPVRLDLHARALRVAATANARLAMLDGPYPTLVVDSAIDAGRASATVTGVPLPLERNRRILGSAIDAAG